MSVRVVNQIVITGVTLKSINQEIAEREQYRLAQEALIEKLTNDGNNYLLSLNYEIEAAEKQLKAAKAKLYELARETYTAEEDLRLLKQDILDSLETAGMSPSFGV